MTIHNKLLLEEQTGILCFGGAHGFARFGNALRVHANPKVNVEIGTEQFPTLAAIAEEPERTNLYDKMTAKSRFFAEYQKNTTRIIPVIILTRRSKGQLTP